MSKSYKKYPGFRVNDQTFKKMANRKVRNTKDIPSGGAYKKNGMTWDVCDQRGRCTFKEWMDGVWSRYLNCSWINRKIKGKKREVPPPNEEEEFEVWKEFYFRK